MSTYYFCPSNATQFEGHIPDWRYCSSSNSSAWQVYTEDQIRQELGVDSFPESSMYSLLYSMNDIDPYIVSLYMGYALAFFVTGYAAGTVLKFLRR